MRTKALHHHEGDFLGMDELEFFVLNINKLIFGGNRGIGRGKFSLLYCLRMSC